MQSDCSVPHSGRWADFVADSTIPCPWSGQNIRPRACRYVAAVSTKATFSSTRLGSGASGRPTASSSVSSTAASNRRVAMSCTQESNGERGTQQLRWSLELPAAALPAWPPQKCREAMSCMKTAPALVPHSSFDGPSTRHHRYMSSTFSCKVARSCRPHAYVHYLAVQMDCYAQSVVRAQALGNAAACQPNPIRLHHHGIRLRCNWLPCYATQVQVVGPQQLESVQSALFGGVLLPGHVHWVPRPHATANTSSMSVARGVGHTGQL
jgi:hypothetical protein